MRFVFLCLFVVITTSRCNFDSQNLHIPKNRERTDSSAIHQASVTADTSEQTDPAWIYTDSLNGRHINPGTTRAEDLVTYAETLVGTPYLYGSSDPTRGFDCSGFITFVFNHFNISVPRSSEGFTSVEREISLKEAKRGDVILFTGTDSTKRIVGHMGIITSRNNGHKFIHSTSGKAYGVTVTPLNKYYQGRFVKVIRIFN